MKSNSAFLNAKPTRKTEVLADGYDYLTVSIDAATLNLKKLNAWLKQLPDMIVKNQAIITDDNLTKAFATYTKATDALTCEMVVNAEAIKKVYDTLQSLNRYDSTSETIQPE